MIGEKRERMNEAMPVKNNSKNPQSFLEISPVQARMSGEFD